MNNGNCTGTYVTVPLTSGSIDAEGNVVGDTNPPPEKGLLHQAIGVVTASARQGGMRLRAGAMVWGAAKLMLRVADR
ncbi:hypothetical protein QCE73_19925 [Caballeronia sp. LZ029]|uniref:hypothetical protein n=1 Tax=Caballeronia sp. LZ029 TaxID=3038564 RepID=UPI0028623496|nr:hypothetical protein [Caballeronia sp. LZ029]MDR5745433.1 hypothetical protein [Caballeronia sp. LZ029]